ncbi:uncharacterized protein BJ212DRAFT_1449998 [Suillus subaureus]|uniref:Uncharacterized protein n=1 Tax=Suillus subaureus TaxID=48587 RepID=A0A9P7J4H9_9AGAM|nr:uncharacterized protein BJ212DRAFT_1449998 [Suillus subaureus]KAG1802386.1 hypothetical protein BJ212DRAFT_1449998 [Suillus subaureus]
MTSPVLPLRLWNCRKRRQLANKESRGPRLKKFNFSTYKFHAMGDYVRTIKLFGTMDSFTTQINFILKLKDHILYWLKKLDVSHCDYTFSDKEHNSVIIPNYMVYVVNTMQVHYTTYYMRCEYDTINPKTNTDIMVLSGETSPSHPYWYAHVLGIYQLDTWIEGSQTEKHHLTFLHVRPWHNFTMPWKFISMSQG